MGKYCKLSFTLEEIRAGNEEEIAYLCLVLLHCMYISKRVPSLMKTALSLPEDVQEILYCLLNGLLKESSAINREDLQNALDRLDNGNRDCQSQPGSFCTPVQGNEEVFSSTPRMKPFHQFFQSPIVREKQMLEEKARKMKVLENQLEAEKMEKEDLNEEFQKIMAESRTKDERISRLEVQALKLQRIQEEMEQKLKEVNNGTCQGSQEEIIHLRSQAHGLKIDLNFYKEEFKTVSDERNQYLEKVKVLETSLKKLKEELSGRVELEVENEELKLKVEALVDSHKALEIRCEELTSFIEQMRGAGRTACLPPETLECVIDKLLQEKTQELEELQQCYEKLKGQRASECEEWAKTKSSWEAKVANVTEEKNRTVLKLQAVEENLNVQETKCWQMQKDMQSLQHKLHSLQEEFGTMKEENAKLGEEKEKQSMEVTHLHSCLNNITSERDHLQSVLNEKCEQEKLVKDKIDSLDNKILELQDIVCYKDELLESTERKYKEQVFRFEGKLKEKESQLLEGEKKFQEMEKNLQHSMSIHKELKSTIIQLEDMKSHHMAVMKGLQENLEGCIHQMDALQQEKKEKEVAVAEKIQIIQNLEIEVKAMEVKFMKLEEVQDQLQSEKLKVEELNKQQCIALENLQKELHDEMHQMQELKSVLSEKEAIITLKTEEVSGVTSQLHQKEIKCQEYEECQKDLQSQIMGLQESESKLSMAVAKLEQNFAESLREKEICQRELEKNEVVINKQIEQIHLAEKQIQITEEECLRLAKIQEELEVQLRKLVEKHKSQGLVLVDAQNNLQEHILKVEQLTQELEQKNVVIQEKLTEVTDLQESVHRMRSTLEETESIHKKENDCVQKEIEERSFLNLKLEQQLEETKNVICQKNEQISILEQNLLLKDQELHVLQEEIKDSNQKLKDLQQQIQEKETLITHTYEEICDSQTMLQGARDAVGKLEAEKSALEEARKEQDEDKNIMKDQLQENLNEILALKQQVEEKEHIINQKNDEIHQTEEELHEIKSQMEQLKTQYQTLEKEINCRDTQVQLWEQQLEEKQNFISQKDEKISALEQDLLLKDQEFHVLQEKVDDSNQQLKDLCQQMQEKETIISQKHEEICASQVKLQEAKDAVVKLEAEKSVLEKARKRQDDDLITVEDQLHEHLNQLQTFELRVEEKENIINQKNDEIHQTEEELHEIKSQMEQLKTQYQTLEKEINCRDAKVQLLKQQLHEKENLANQKNDEVCVMTEKLCTAESALNEIRNKYDAVNKQLQSNITQLKELKQQTEEKGALTVKKIEDFTSLQDEVCALRVIKAESDSQLKEMNGYLSNMMQILCAELPDIVQGMPETEVESIEQFAASKELEVTSAMHKLQTILAKIISEFHAKIKTMGDVQTTLTEEKATIQEKLNDLEKEKRLYEEAVVLSYQKLTSMMHNLVSAGRDSLGAALEESTSVKDSFASFEASLQELVSTLYDMGASLLSCNKSLLNSSEENFQKLASALSQMQSQYQSAHEEIDLLKNELAESRRQLDLAREEVCNLRNTLEADRNAYEEEREELVNMNYELKQKLQGEKDDFENLCNNLEVENSNLNEQVKDLETSQAELLSEFEKSTVELSKLQELQEKVSSLEAENIMMSEKLKELEASKKNEDVKEDELKAKVSTLEKEVKKLVKTGDSLKHDCETLRAELSEKETQLENTHSNAMKYQERMEQLQVDLERFKRQKVHTDSDIVDLERKKIELEMKIMDLENKHLEKLYQAKNEMKSIFKSEVEKVSAMCEEVKREKDQLSAKYEASKKKLAELSRHLQQQESKYEEFLNERQKIGEAYEAKRSMLQEAKNTLDREKTCRKKAEVKVELLEKEQVPLLEKIRGLEISLKREVAARRSAEVQTKYAEDQLRKLQKQLDGQPPIRKTQSETNSGRGVRRRAESINSPPTENIYETIQECEGQYQSSRSLHFTRGASVSAEYVNLGNRANQEVFKVPRAPAGSTTSLASSSSSSSSFHHRSVPLGTEGRGHEDTCSRMSELSRRNTLYLPHMKSSYPCETQFIEPTHFTEHELKAGVNFEETSIGKLVKSAEDLQLDSPAENTRSKTRHTLLAVTPLKGGRYLLHTSQESPLTDSPAFSTRKRKSPDSVRSFGSLNDSTSSRKKVSKLVSQQTTYQRPGPPTPGKYSSSQKPMESDTPSSVSSTGSRSRFMPKTPASIHRLLGHHRSKNGNPKTPKRKKQIEAENTPPTDVTQQVERKNTAFTIGFSPKQSKPSRKPPQSPPHISTKQKVPKTSTQTTTRRGFRAPFSNRSNMVKK
ncbi:unnamed protein product [Darwinula stevensoni]|uniref:Uncharacterized protein n=1 Tax=Darwinula stevensoni TaxID=69355 RepID=A0A7R8ZZB5_9CRUS|nr:unnamed protein product [Darwinula stevensoni]CAG0878563.1 unnamed protein product [Darwinula stevensoni]